MKSGVAALLLLLAVPAATFVCILNRDIRLAPLEGIDAKCLVCDRKATRTLKRAAEALRTKGIYIYERNDYPNGMPVWCDRHGPEKARENSPMAYLGAIAAFVVAGTAYEKTRRSR